MIDIPEGLHPIHAYAVRRVDQPWPFAVTHKEEIAQHWEQRKCENPKFFNGRVYIMIEASLQDGLLQGCVVETDFASSLYWRESGFADSSVVDCFAAAIILCADDALIYGRQAAGNVNAGLAYPPSGFLDPRDVRADGSVDLEASAAREVFEETGLTTVEIQRESGLLAVRQGPYLCIGVGFCSPLASAAFLETVTARLRDEHDPELEAMIVLKRQSDTELHPMRDYAKRIAQHVLAE